MNEENQNTDKFIILITGSNGFVGINLRKFLRNDFNLFLASKNISNKNEEKFINFKDINVSYLNYNKIDTVIHLAGKAHDLNKVTKLEEYYDVNFELTKKLYDVFLNSEASKFIFISSVKASADQVEDVLKESDVPDPKTHYGKSKLMAEEYIQSQPLPEGKSYFILRPCMIHGPGNKGNLNLLFNLVSKGIPWPLGTFENKRSFTSIENLQFVIQQLIEKDIAPGTYQIADDEPLSTNQLIELIATSQGKKASIWKINSKFIAFAAHIGDKLHLPLNSERLKKLTESYVVSNNKIKKALGIEKMPVSAEEGMRKTLSSF